MEQGEQKPVPLSPVFEGISPAQSVATIAAQARRMKREQGLELIVGADPPQVSQQPEITQVMNTGHPRARNCNGLRESPMEATERLDRLEAKLDSLVDLLTKSRHSQDRRWFSAAEFASETGMTRQVVSRYCKQGRLKGVRSEARRGPRKEWRLSVDEVRRYKEQGLLPAS